MVRRSLWIGLMEIVFGFIILCFIFYVGTGSAKTITVDDDGGADFESIQDAIDAANDGDTIRVFAGAYNENVIIRKTLNLVGNGSEETTIDGGEDGDVVEITADRVNMSGFHVTGSGYRRYGIKIESDYNLIFKNNCSNNGFGMHLDNFSHNTITNNTCSSNDYNGIFMKYALDCTIVNNTCLFNYFNSIYFQYSSNITITNNTCSSTNSDGIHVSSVKTKIPL